jgi:O-antigen/teichoic acid export membrane protein
MSRSILVKNAFANVCRGGSSALVALLLPPFLTRIINKDAYGTWLLILQLSTYVGFLDFGIQTAVGRYVAHHNELGEIRERDSFVSTALAILVGSAVLGLLGISILAWQLPNLFKDMPVTLHQDAQLALLLVGGSLAVALPFSVFGGIFIGLQRYDIPAWIVGISKLLGGLSVLLVANTSHSIVMMAVVMGITNVGSGLWQFLAYDWLAGDIQISKQGISKTKGVEITSYCFSLSVWTIGMLLVSGMDTVIIGYFDYRSIVYYGLAASLTSFLTSLHSSIFGVFMPKAAVLGAKQDREALGNLLIASTRYGAILLIASSLPLVLGSKLILTLWVGVSYANQTALLLQIMVIANLIRYLGAPYATIALAIGEQKRLILSPVVEGLVNIIISIILTSYYGVIGVAIGTLCGAFVSVGMHFFYNLKRTHGIHIKNKRLLFYSVIRPLTSVFPVTLFYLFCGQIDLPFALEFIFLVSVSIISYIFLWNYSVLTTEQDSLRTLIHSRIKYFLAIWFKS